uniref:Mediator of RNA polymerase II transcription subunit 29 n=1 Tax=Gopherus evgoodei TaxID=1825980 RepID=A0A8C4VTF7_9SAUR
MAAPQQQPQAPSQAPAPGPQLTLQAGPGPQPQLQAQAAAQAQAQAAAQAQAQDFDPVQRYKMLIPQLKESLQEHYQLSPADGGARPSAVNALMLQARGSL